MRMRRSASGSEMVKASVSLDIGEGAVKRYRLARSDEGAQAALDDFVRQSVGVGVALAKDMGMKQR